jgi:hypothetical protein
VAGSFEHCNEPSDSIKCCKMLKQLRKWPLLKEWLGSMELVAVVLIPHHSMEMYVGVEV